MSNMDNVIDVRVFYKKLDRAKYISHLDIVRLFQRVFTRAKLPVWYSQGFNPHIYITFALPLPIFYESECEVMDFRLVEDLPLDEVTKILNENLPYSICVEKTAKPKYKASEIVNSINEIILDCGNNNVDEIYKSFNDFLKKEKILVMKKTKKGKVEVDIKPDFEIIKSEVIDNKIKILIKITSGQTRNVNPSLVTDAFLNEYNEYQDVIVSVLRKRMLVENGENFK